MATRVVADRAAGVRVTEWMLEWDVLGIYDEFQMTTDSVTCWSAHMASSRCEAGPWL